MGGGRAIAAYGDVTSKTDMFGLVSAAREAFGTVRPIFQSPSSPSAFEAHQPSRARAPQPPLDLSRPCADLTSWPSQVHVLVNNALAHYQFNPASKSASITTVEWSDFDQQLKGTLAGAVNAVQACLPTFNAQGFGKVVNIGTNLVYNPVV
eukprot:6192858-Prymnesium_polylepis.1